MSLHSARERGQALLELAVFGSLMIFALGALVNFGLKTDFTQQAMMGSFRQALASASEAPGVNGTPIAVSYVRIDDRHIPNPSNPFAIGSVLPTAAEARSVTRNYKTQEVGGTVAELPRIRITIDGQDVDCPSAGLGCTIAGFRVENDVSPESLDRYHEIYGPPNVCDKEECGGGNGKCLQTEIDQQTQEEVCVKFAKNVKILDRCEGEIISLDDCVGQARLIVDSQVCAALCEKGKAPGSRIDCNDVCSKPMNVPWYAQGARLIDADHRRYDFPKLNQLFAGIRALGLQPGSSKATKMTDGLGIENKKEKKEGKDDDDKETRKNQATTTIRWRDDTTRRVIRTVKPLEYTQDPDNPLTVTRTKETEDSVPTKPKDEDSITTWTTPW